MQRSKLTTLLMVLPHAAVKVNNPWPTKRRTKAISFDDNALGAKSLRPTIVPLLWKDTEIVRLQLRLECSWEPEALLLAASAPSAVVLTVLTIAGSSSRAGSCSSGMSHSQCSKIRLFADINYILLYSVKVWSCIFAILEHPTLNDHNLAIWLN